MASSVVVFVDLNGKGLSTILGFLKPKINNSLPAFDGNRCSIMVGQYTEPIKFADL